MPHGDSADRDQARSYERLDESDLARLGRAAHAELDAFFARNPHLAGWRDRVRIIALAQGGAEHYLRGRRGVRDLDVIVCFADDSRLPRLFRRMVVSWDWGPSKLGRCPHDPPQYTGRAVDIAFWVIPDRPSALAGLREWLAARAGPTPLPQATLTVQRPVSSRGGIQVARQRIHVGMTHAGKIVTVVTETNSFRLAIGGEAVGVVPRTTSHQIGRYQGLSHPPPKAVTPCPK